MLERHLPDDPKDIEWRFLLADALFKAWEDDRCREQAQAGGWTWMRAARQGPVLTADQRRKLNIWKELPGGTRLRR